jgi:hypothetical protein
MITGYYGSINSSAANARELWGPMIKFSLSNSLDPNQTHIVETDLTALIDTGSDLSRIDSDLAERHGLHMVGQQPSISGGMSSIVNVYALQVLLDDQPKRSVLQLLCPAVRLRGSGGPYDLLFGMDAIRFFDLSVNRSRELVSLIWVGGGG